MGAFATSLLREIKGTRLDIVFANMRRRFGQTANFMINVRQKELAPSTLFLGKTTHILPSES